MKYLPKIASTFSCRKCSLCMQACMCSDHAMLRFRAAFDLRDDIQKPGRYLLPFACRDKYVISGCVFRFFVIGVLWGRNFGLFVPLGWSILNEEEWLVVLCTTGLASSEKTHSINKKQPYSCSDIGCSRGVVDIGVFIVLIWDDLVGGQLVVFSKTNEANNAWVGYWVCYGG